MIPERKIDGYFYVWHRLNMNLTSAGVALWDDVGSETHNCLYSEWFHFNPMADGTDMFDFELANGMSCELLEPLKRYRLGYESDELQLDLLWEGAYAPPNLHYDNSAEGGFDVYGDSTTSSSVRPRAPSHRTARRSRSTVITSATTRAAFARVRSATSRRRVRPRLGLRAKRLRRDDGAARADGSRDRPIDRPARLWPLHQGRRAGDDRRRRARGVRARARRPSPPGRHAAGGRERSGAARRGRGRIPLQVAQSLPCSGVSRSGRSTARRAGANARTGST